MLDAERGAGSVLQQAEPARARAWAGTRTKAEAQAWMMEQLEPEPEAELEQSEATSLPGAGLESESEPEVDVQTASAEACQAGAALLFNASCSADFAAAAAKFDHALRLYPENDQARRFLGLASELDLETRIANFFIPINTRRTWRS